MKSMKRVLCLVLFAAMLLSTLPACAAMDLMKTIEMLNANPIPTSSQTINVELENEDGDGYGQWKKGNNNTMQFRCKIYNHHWSKTVKAVELYLDGRNIWGDSVHDDILAHTTIKKIASGENAYSDYITLTDRSQISEVHVRINRVMYTDGSIETNNDLDDYHYWSIEWN